MFLLIYIKRWYRYFYILRDLTRASCNICFSWAVYQTLLVSKLTCYLVNLGRWPRQSEFEIKRVLTNERDGTFFNISFEL